MKAKRFVPDMRFLGSTLAIVFGTIYFLRSSCPVGGWGRRGRTHCRTNCDSWCSRLPFSKEVTPRLENRDDA